MCVIVFIDCFWSTVYALCINKQRHQATSHKRLAKTVSDVSYYIYGIMESYRLQTTREQTQCKNKPKLHHKQR